MNHNHGTDATISDEILASSDQNAEKEEIPNDLKDLVNATEECRTDRNIEMMIPMIQEKMNSNENMGDLMTAEWSRYFITTNKKKLNSITK